MKLPLVTIKYGRHAGKKCSARVFLDLGFSEARSVDLMFESCLLQAIQDTIKSRGWKQVEAAVQLGIDQAKI